MVSHLLYEPCIAASFAPENRRTEMIRSESTSLLPGLDSSATQSGSGLHKKEEEAPLEGFLQVWTKVSEENDALASIDDALGEAVLPEGIPFLIQDGKGQTEVEDVSSVENTPGVIVAAAALDMSAQTHPSNLAPESGEITQQTPVIPELLDGSKEVAHLTALKMGRSTSMAPSGDVTDTKRDYLSTEDQSVAPDPDRIGKFGLNPEVSVGPEGEGSAPAQGVEMSTFLESLDHETAAPRVIPLSTEQAVELKTEGLKKSGLDQTSLFDLGGKGDGVIKSLSSMGSGAADLDGGSGRSFQGKEDGKISPVVLGQPLSEAFSGLIQVDSEGGLDRSVQVQLPAAETRLPDGIPSEKMLLRQVTEKIQLWRPHTSDVIRFQLEPETLGMLQVDISLNENGVVAKIITEHHFVKTLLEQNQNMLRETLSEKGLSVDQFSVNVGTPNDQNADRQNNRQPSLEVPRNFPEQDERFSHFDASKLRQSGDYRINLYI